MNLSYTFLGEMFVIFHRKYLSFFRYLQKSFGKKYALKNLKIASSRALSRLKNICGFYQDRFYSSIWIDFI